MTTVLNLVKQKFTGGGLEPVYVLRPDVAATDTVPGGSGGSCGRQRQQLPQHAAAALELGSAVRHSPELHGTEPLRRRNLDSAARPVFQPPTRTRRSPIAASLPVGQRVGSRSVVTEM